jgi:hypothetical protein
MVRASGEHWASEHCREARSFGTCIIYSLCGSASNVYGNSNSFLEHLFSFLSYLLDILVKISFCGNILGKIYSPLELHFSKYGIWISIT